MVHLVEDHEGAARSIVSSRCRAGLHRDLRVGHGDAVEVPGGCGRGALLNAGSSRMPARAAASAHWRLRCSVGATTVMRSMTRRRTQLGGEAQGERGLAGAGRRGGEEVARLLGEVLLEGLGLPGAQLARGAPSRALGEGRGEVFGGRGARLVAGRGRGAHWIRG